MCDTVMGCCRPRIVVCDQTEGQYRAGPARPPLLQQDSATTAMYNSAAHAGAFIGLARAKVDFTPPEGDSDSLTYKVSPLLRCRRV